MFWLKIYRKFINQFIVFLNRIFEKKKYNLYKENIENQNLIKTLKKILNIFENKFYSFYHFENFNMY